MTRFVLFQFFFAVLEKTNHRLVKPGSYYSFLIDLPLEVIVKKRNFQGTHWMKSGATSTLDTLRETAERRGMKRQKKRKSVEKVTIMN